MNNKDILSIAVHKIRNDNVMRRIRIRQKDTAENIFSKYCVALAMSMNHELYMQGYIQYDSVLVLYFQETKDFKENLRLGYSGDILIEFEKDLSPRNKLSLLFEKEEQLRKEVFMLAKKMIKNREIIERIFDEITKELLWDRKNAAGKSYRLEKTLAKGNKEGVLQYQVFYLSKLIFTEKINCFEKSNNISALKYKFKKAISDKMIAMESRRKYAV